MYLGCSVYNCGCPILVSMLRVNTRVEKQGDRTGGEERLSIVAGIAKSEHDRRDGTGRRRPRRGRGGGVGAALPAARRCAVLPILVHRALGVLCILYSVFCNMYSVFSMCSFCVGKKKKKNKNPRTPTSVFISVIRYAEANFGGRTGRYHVTTSYRDLTKFSPGRLRIYCSVCLLLQDLLQSCSRGGEEESGRHVL